MGIVLLLYMGVVIALTGSATSHLNGNIPVHVKAVKMMINELPSIISMNDNPNQITDIPDEFLFNNAIRRTFRETFDRVNLNFGAQEEISHGHEV